MGFLDVNTRKRSRQSTKGRKLCKPATQAPRSQDDASTHPNQAHIERLPRDILEVILVMSGNLNLAQASTILSQRLSRTPSLEVRLLKACMVDKGIPSRVALWPFVTADLLKKLGVENFLPREGDSGPPVVPSAIEHNLTLANLDLVAFMVEHGCLVDDSRKLTVEFARAGYWDALKHMLRADQRASAEAAKIALESGQSADIVILLLDRSGGLELSREVVWSVRQAAWRANEADVCAFLDKIEERIDLSLNV